MSQRYWLGQWSHYFRVVNHLPCFIENLIPLVRLALGASAAQLQFKRNNTVLIVTSLVDAWVVFETFVLREYETIDLDSANIATVVDIGAGVGDFTIWVRRTWPSATVIAVEPSPKSLALLEKNLKINCITDVCVISRGVGAAGTYLVMRENSSTELAREQSKTLSEGAGDPITKASLTLGEVCELLGDQACDLMKIDCEGAEFPFLLQASREELRKVQRFVIEYHDVLGVDRYTYKDLMNHLKCAGFRVVIQPSKVHKGYGYMTAEQVA